LIVASLAARRIGTRVATYVTVALFCLFAAFPFLWATITMFKQSSDLYTPSNNPFLYNEPPTLEHLRLLLERTAYLTFVRNSVVVGVLVVAITLVAALPAAYALARLTGRWGERLGIGIFLVYLVPPTLLFIPLSRVVASIGLQDSLWSLVVVYPSFTIPVSVWLLMGFFKAIPRDIEEQAQVDGYSRVGALVRAVLPLALPGVFTVVVFAFTLTMHEFIYALAFISTTSQKTISIGVPTELIRGDVFFWQSLMAAGVLVAIPVALVYNLFLDRFIQGFTRGAVKG
jgi:multiple sugar transport system permease protein